MAWLEAVTNYFATLTYKFLRGDSEERRERRREEYYNSYGTEEGNSQYPYGSQQIDSVYGHEQWSGSEKRRRDKPQEEERYKFRIRDQSGDTEIDVVRRQRVGKKKGRGFSLCRRVDYEERGKEVREQKPYSSRMYDEENEYLPEVGDYEEGVGRNAAAGMHERVHREHRKRR